MEEEPSEYNGHVLHYLDHKFLRETINSGGHCNLYICKTCNVKLVDILDSKLTCNEQIVKNILE